jgi:hypothetical protein
VSLDADLVFIRKKFGGDPRTERDIKWAIRYVGGRMEDVALWDNDVGLAEKQGRPIHFGLCVGSSDLIGIFKPTGRFLAFEVKGPKGRATVEQQNFIQLIRSYGGIAEIVRSVHDFLAVITRLRTNNV